MQDIEKTRSGWEHGVKPLELPTLHHSQDAFSENTRLLEHYSEREGDGSATIH